MNGTRLLLRNPISKTAATGLSSNNVFSSRHVTEPLVWFISVQFLRLPHGTPSKECLR